MRATRSKGARVAPHRPRRLLADSRRPPPPRPAALRSRVEELSDRERDLAIPAIRSSFEGYYRWHAKRTLREVAHVRAVRRAGGVIAISMFEELAPGVGYVNYLAVEPAYRRLGVGARLLDDALGYFGRRRMEVVFAAAKSSNRPSIALLASRGFRRTRRKERPYHEGGLGAWGLRSRMHIVGGEVVLGLRLSIPRPS